MNSDIHVDLSDRLDAEPPFDIDEKPDLYCITAEEGYPLKYISSAGILTGKRLSQHRKIKKEEVEKWIIR